MSHPTEPADDEEVDLCDLDFNEDEATSDEDLPVTFGGEG